MGHVPPEKCEILKLQRCVFLHSEAQSHVLRPQKNNFSVVEEDSFELYAPINVKLLGGGGGGGHRQGI